MFDIPEIKPLSPLPDIMNLKPLCAPVMLLGFAACATAKPVDDTGAAPTPTSSVQSGSSGAPVRWTGSLQPMQQRSGGLGPTGQNKAFGNVALSSKGSDRTAISISLSTPLQGSSALSWAILPGRCGSGALPIVGIERFPAIDVGNNGRAQLDTEMALELPSNGAYHVNIYWAGGQQLSDVMTCANLKKL